MENIFRTWVALYFPWKMKITSLELGFEWQNGRGWDDESFVCRKSWMWRNNELKSRTKMGAAKSDQLLSSLFKPP